MSECAIATASSLLSYEQTGARNIERNNARLRSLGLISTGEERRSNDAAWGHSQIKDAFDNDDGPSPSDDEEYTSKVNSSTNKKKRVKTSAAAKEGSRKSRRIMNLPAEHSSSISADNMEEDATQQKERIKKEREAMVTECREARQRAALEVAKAGVQAAGKENPTATYEHCLMRVRTMSEKGLANRIKAIERASGKHCVVKMAIFKSCLQDENLWELAGLAAEALERLKGLLPPPSE